MSNSLIERLRSLANSSHLALAPALLLEAADALEAKAAPVAGAREEFEAAYAKCVDDGWTSVKHLGRKMFEAGAAYQRAQQPQSAEAFQKPSVLKDCNVRYSTSTTPQPSAVPDWLRAKLAEGLDEITSLSRHLRQGGCDSTDLPGLEEGLRHAIDMAAEMLSVLDDAAPSAPATVQCVNQQLLEALEELMYASTDKAEALATAAIAAARQEGGKV